jgi:hypothetical protein
MKKRKPNFPSVVHAAIRHLKEEGERCAARGTQDDLEHAEMCLSSMRMLQAALELRQGSHVAYAQANGRYP